MDLATPPCCFAARGSVRGGDPGREVATREPGPVVFVDGDEVWNREKMTTDEEWVTFAGFLQAMVRWKGVGA
jgi:hypothetical protein